MAKTLTETDATLALEAREKPVVDYSRRRILWLRTRKAMTERYFWLGLCGIAMFFVGWDLAYRFELPRMEKLDSPLSTFREFTLPPRGAFTYNPALESKWGYGIWGKAWYTDIGM